MIIAYLEELEKEYLAEKWNAEKRLSELRLKCKQDETFLLMLKKADDSELEGFSPRIEPKQQQEEKEISERLSELKEEILAEEKKYENLLLKLDELKRVLEEGRSIRKTAAEKSDANHKDFYDRIRLLEIQEKERQRISRELHDDTVQSLTALMHKMEFCSKIVEQDAGRCKLELNSMTEYMHEVIAEIRRLIFDLRPMSSEDIRPDIKIKQILNEADFEGVKKIQFRSEGEPYSVSYIMGITILRILQEACGNALKHANAEHIWIVMIYESDGLRILVKDDGIGFIPEKEKERVSQNKGYGLETMKERVYLLSGEISIESELMSGTTIKITIPK